jgi:glycosyltransferase involved in cell wall biosynthesis
MPYALTLLGGKFIRDKHVTGYWAWELPHVPHNWVFGLSAVHDVAVPSRFTADAVQRLSPELPVRIAPHPVSLAHPAPHLALGEVKARPFTILSACSIASGFNRKNPLATIRAFRRAFGSDSSKRLKLLVTNVHHFPQARDAIEAEINGSRNIQASWRVLEPMAFARWWSEGDVYLSLHRAEGFGLPLAEAMCAGMPAVATGWSGNVDYMDTANGYLIEYSLIDVDDAQGKYPSDLGQWAEPNIEHASAILAHLATNKASATAKACAYAASAQSRLSGKAFVDSLTKSNCRV